MVLVEEEQFVPSSKINQACDNLTVNDASPMTFADATDSDSKKVS